MVESRSAGPRSRVVALAPRHETGLLSTSTLAQTNRSHVLQALADHGPLSRADLARLSGVTRASVGGVVSGLLAEGFLEEQPVEVAAPGAGNRRVGKPSRPLRLGDLGTFGSVVIQPGVIETGLVDPQGVVSQHRRDVLPMEGPVDDFDAAAVRHIRRALGGRRSSLPALGMALPGFFDEHGHILASTTIDALPGSRLPELVAAAVGTTVVLEDDARALALGQRWFGQARGTRDFAAIQIGDGIGAGIMLDGRLHRGRLAAAEIGHMTVDLNGERCRCGLVGCWETVASLRWLRRRSGQAGLPGPESLTPGRLATLADTDSTAAGILDEYADHVALGIANLFHVLSIPHIVLHGSVVDAGERFLDRVQERVAARIMPAVSARPTIALDQNRDRSAVLGAAAAAITHHLGVFL